jgi:peptide/nickel transport system substrate-binding protein
MQRHRWLFLVTVLTIFSLLLAACGAAATPAPAAEPTTAAPAAEATTAAPAAEPTAAESATEPTAATEPAAEATTARAPTKEAASGSGASDGLVKLTYSDEQKPVWVRNFNPYSPDPLNSAQNMLFEPLFIFKIAKNGEPEPWLATEYTYSEDLKSITFKLREGVKWSDGEDFDADDVVFTFNMLKEFPSLDKSAVWEILTDIKKDDAHSVTFNLNKVYTLAHERIATVMIAPEHQWSKVKDPVTFTNDEPIGTGPFTEITVFQDQIYEQCKNPHYWQEGKPKFDCVRFPANPGNEQAIAGLVAGEIDWAGHFIPDIEKTFVAADEEHHHYYFTANDTISLYLNTSKKPFDDLKFRQALSMAVDRDEIVDIATYGYATVNDNPGGLTAVFRDWYNKEAIEAHKPLGTFAPEEATKLLDEAGYVDKDGDGKRDMPDGSPLKFKVQVVNGWTDWVNAVQMTAEYFQDIGLDAEVDTPDFGAWFENLQAGTYDVSIGWGSVNPTPWNYYHDALSSAMIIKDRANGISWSRWNSPETDKLIDEFVATTDADKQREIINQLQVAVMDNVPFIPLFANPGWYEYNTKEFTGFPTPENYYARGMNFEGIYERLIVLTTIEPVK